MLISLRMQSLSFLFFVVCVCEFTLRHAHVMSTMRCRQGFKVAFLSPLKSLATRNMLNGDIPLNPNTCKMNL